MGALEFYRVSGADRHAGAATITGVGFQFGLRRTAQCGAKAYSLEFASILATLAIDIGESQTGLCQRDLPGKGFEARIEYGFRAGLHTFAAKIATFILEADFRKATIAFVKQSVRAGVNAGIAAGAGVGEVAGGPGWPLYRASACTTPQLSSGLGNAHLCTYNGGPGGPIKWWIIHTTKP